MGGEPAAIRKALAEQGLGDFWWSKGGMYQEARSYSRGRLDMPLLSKRKPFDSLPWQRHPALMAVCNLASYQGAECKQSVLGALWNMPGSKSTDWHRDGSRGLELLVTAVVATEEYPLEAGMIHVQPNS